MQHYKSNGFTLLELSIVLTIIGFLVAGVVVGQSLMRESQIRTMLGEYDEYSKAIQEFEDKYQALPGDMSTAQNIWGSLAVGVCNGSTGVTTVSTGTATCNGNGNGTIGNSSAGSTGIGGEYWYAWQHLSNAGLIEGRFTGADYASTIGIPYFGINTPASKLGSGGWMVLYYSNTAGTNAAWADSYGHILVFGAANSTPLNYSPVLTPTEALAIDRKLDDGIPLTGKIRVWRYGLNPNCTNDSVGTVSQTVPTYTTAYASPACSLMFLLGI